MQAPKSSLDYFTSHLKWLIVAPLSVLIFLLINLGLLRARPGLFLQITPEAMEAAPMVVKAQEPTGTPYQPQKPTPVAPGVMSAGPVVSMSAPMVVSPAPGPSTDFYGIDFSPGAGLIQIILKPQKGRIIGGKPIVIPVIPGRNCPYPEHRACVNAYRSEDGGNVILISVHSGVGGEAEAFRRAVEGLGVDQAGFTLKQIRSNMARLEGAEVEIRQGEREVNGLRLAGIGRVAPTQVREYFHVSAEQAMDLAASTDPGLAGLTQPGGPVLAFETCGWRLAGEPWAPGVTSTTGSVYVGVIEAGE
jgi:hypothetical protein